MIEFSQVHFFELVEGYRLEDEVRKLRKKAVEHSDPVLRDLVIISKVKVADVNKQQAARLLREIAPLSPLTAAAFVRYDSGSFNDKIAEWDRSFGTSIDYLNALAERYQIEGQPGEAIKRLQRILQLEPAYDTAINLAGIYHDQGDLGNWKATLEAALKIPSAGLDDDHVRVLLAQHHMRRGEWKAAKVYADEAARSGAGWAMQCAADCSQGLNDWATAETIHRAVAERYSTSNFDWYLWCQSTGHGDLNAAREAAKASIDELRGGTGSYAHETVGVYELMEGNLDAAFDQFRKAFETPIGKALPDGYHALHCIIIADQLGRTEMRDQSLQMLIDKSPTQGPLFVELARLFRRDLSNGGKGSLDTPTVDWILHRAGSPGEVANLLYFVGKYQEVRGNKDQAREYLQRAAGSEARERHNTKLAGKALRSMGFDIPPPHQPMFSSQVTRAFELTLRGEQQFEKSHLVLARSLYDKALQANPEFTVALYQRGRLTTAQERWADAISDYGRLIELLPNDAMCRNYRGRVLEFHGQHAAAIKDFEAALRIDPSCGAAHNNLVFLYAACIDPQFRNGSKALEHARQVQKCDDVSPQARHAAMGVAYAATGDYVSAANSIEAAHVGASMPERLKFIQYAGLFHKQQPYIRQPNWWR